MTTAADDRTAEDAFEALLAGRPTPAGAVGLAAFTGAVRASAASPGRPNAALADLLATGLLVDQSSPSARTARSAGTSPSRGSRSRIRRRTAMFFPALIAKLLSAGAVAQAATGATVVVVAFAGAGAAGVLPGPVQDTFTSIVSDETEDLPIDETEEPPADEAPVAEEAPVEEAPVEEAPVEDAPVDELPTTVEDWMSAPITGSFGDWVSYARHNPALMAAIRESGYNFGYYVSRRAHDKGMTEEDLAEEGVDLDELTDDGTAEAPEDTDAEADDAPRQTADDSDRRGNGNGHGHGNGRGNGSGGNRGNGHGSGNGSGHGNGRN